MLGFLPVGIAIWAADFVHGLHSRFGAIVVALLAFAPRIGVVDHDAIGEADLSIILSLGATFAIAVGLRRTAFTDLAAASPLSLLPVDPPLPVVLILITATSVVLAFVMEGIVVASVIIPVFVSFANGADISLVQMAIIESVGLSGYFLPYQSAVLVATSGLDVVDSVDLSRMASACTVTTLVVMLPIQIGLFALAL